jgi:hypothetical protein
MLELARLSISTSSTKEMSAISCFFPLKRTYIINLINKLLPGTGPPIKDVIPAFIPPVG